MGRIVPVGDSGALGQAILDILEAPEAYRRDPETIADGYAPDSTAAGYEAVFNELRESVKTIANDDRRSADTPSA